MARILLVDDEASTLGILTTLLKSEDYEVVASQSGEEALALLRGEPFDLIMTDIRMLPVNGMEVLRAAREAVPDTAVVMLTAYGTVETAIEAMKLGAFDYVTKPFKVSELIITVQRALAYKTAISENKNLKAQLRTRYRFENMVAESESMKRVCSMIERVAPTDATILIYGDSGTGKELVAKAIHAYSQRKNRSFLAVNCAALPEALLESEMFGHVKGAFTDASANKKGLFEAAEGGTIFLDEIGSMPLSIQGKLLRVLQEKEVRRVGGNETIPVNARVLAATNLNLETLLRQQKFREDLYYRLNVIAITVDPLRQRRADIMPLVYHVIRQELGAEREIPAIDEQTVRILESYAWPGNVRELENAVKHALTFASDRRVTADVLPAKIVEAVGEAGAEADQADVTVTMRGHSLKTFLRAKEKEYLERVLRAVGGDKEEAARALQISLATLYRKLSADSEPETETPAPVDGRAATRAD
ncbi:MAG: sigma-54-dependent Fis family transcriptional regulator [Lentisphaerae bacterium]|nr:sigma-54-dependent Fis family transcriptional regulator [Lentisphaerota bacterium]